MNTNAPSKNTFIISLILAVIGVLGLTGVIAVSYISWTLLGAWVVLALGCVMKGV